MITTWSVSAIQNNSYVQTQPWATRTHSPRMHCCSLPDRASVTSSTSRASVQYSCVFILWADFGHMIKTPGKISFSPSLVSFINTYIWFCFWLSCNNCVYLKWSLCSFTDARCPVRWARLGELRRVQTQSPSPDPGEVSAVGTRTEEAEEHAQTPTRPRRKVDVFFSGNLLETNSACHFHCRRQRRAFLHENATTATQTTGSDQQFDQKQPGF